MNDWPADVALERIRRGVELLQELAQAAHLRQKQIMASARELEKKHKETGVHHERSMSRTRHRGDQAMPHLFSTLNWIWVEIVGEIPGTSVDIDGKNFLNAFPGPEFGGSRPIDWSQNKRSSKNNSALAVGGLVGSRSSMALGSLPQSSFYHGIRSVRRPTPVYKIVLPVRKPQGDCGPETRNGSARSPIFWEGAPCMVLATSRILTPRMEDAQRRDA